MNVFYTIDVETWPTPNCSNSDFERYYERDILGKTANGYYGLFYQLKELSDYGFTANCFVEPLYARQYPIESLINTIELIKQYHSEIHLHIHTEWDKPNSSLTPLVTHNHHPNIADYQLADQISFINEGVSLLKQCGIERIQAFRAGNYGANNTTLQALDNADIHYDTSYNALFPSNHQIVPQHTHLNQSFQTCNVTELPVTVFNARYPKHLRHLQLCACSFAEMKLMLAQAHRLSYPFVVIVSHSFELIRHRQVNRLINSSKTSHDPIVTRRFNKLCQHLDKHRDKYQVVGINEAKPMAYDQSYAMLNCHPLATLQRYIGQGLRRL